MADLAPSGRRARRFLTATSEADDAGGNPATDFQATLSAAATTASPRIEASGALGSVRGFAQRVLFSGLRPFLYQHRQSHEI